MEQSNEVMSPWCFVKTRIKREENQALVRVLIGLGTNRSRLLRKIIRELIGEGPDLLPRELALFGDATYQIGAIGRNLNQLVRAFHSGQLNGGQVDAVILMGVRDHVARLEKELLRVVKRSRQRWVGLPAGRQVNHG